MTAEKLSSVLPSDDLAAAVEFWTSVLGIEPTFVDGDRWAQFDLGGSRLALAGADRTSDAAGVMVKVTDVDAARKALVASGASVGGIEEGPHELRCVVTAPGGHPLTIYGPKQ